MATLVPALSRGLDVLELFLSEHGELTAPEITARLGFPRTTVYQLIQTLLARDYLERGDGPNAFRLGPRALELGSAYASSVDLVREARAAVARITEMTGETAHAALLSGTEVLYIAVGEGRHPVQMVSALGRRLPAHATAIGKALLAALGAQEVRARYAHEPLAILTARTIATVPELEAELARIRASGLAWDDCESNDDVCCVAVSCTERKGLQLALSVSVPTIRWTSEIARRCAAVVREQADLLARRLGGPPDPRPLPFEEAIARNPPPFERGARGR